MPRQEPGSAKALIAGGMAGMIVAVLGHPFDTLKVGLCTLNLLKQPSSISFMQV